MAISALTGVLLRRGGWAVDGQVVAIQTLSPLCFKLCLGIILAMKASSRVIRFLKRESEMQQPAPPSLSASSPSSEGNGSRPEPTWSRWTFIALLLVCGALVYRPALNRFFADDHLWYLVELNGETTLSSGLRLCDYAVARQYNKGDEMLYRPLLFVWLAVENALFQRDFRAWNAANLALHLMTAYLLFHVLRRLKESVFAKAFALLFVVLAANFELVNWNHLGGYMLGFSILLMALMAAWEVGQGGREADARWLWGYGAAITSAMMFHEIAVIAGLLVIPYWFFSLRRKAGVRWSRLAAALCVPLVIYFSLYAMHAMKCERFWWVDKGDPIAGANLPLPLLVPTVMLRWVTETLAPGCCQYAVQVFRRSEWANQGVNAVAASVLLAEVLWFGILMCMRRGFARRKLAAAWPFAALVLAVLLAYTGMVCLGRSYALAITNYTYFFALFSTVLFYSLIDFSQVRGMARVGALAFLAVLGVANGWQTYQTSRMIEAANAPAARYFDMLETCARPHLQEHGFSFAVKGAPPEIDPMRGIHIGYRVRPPSGAMSVSKMVYGKYYDTSHPKIVLTFPSSSSPPGLGTR